ncbi:MAG TPA: alpha/beta fold hydrolase [Candidatus Cybelea sp.]|nr:alpha/beta fold hydrolase [Candidatus Cybelea sp.]
MTQAANFRALAGVETGRFVRRNVRLESGAVLPELALAYETYGRLAADGRNALLATHGYTSSHHAAGTYSGGNSDAGWWDALIGPGKPIDTDRLFVVSSNMLGSAYGSTGPGSLDPRTGRHYGPDFPDITLGDIVAAQKALLDHLGVEHLVAVAGPSFGGFQAFQWAVSYPAFMDGIVAAVTSPKPGAGGEARLRELIERLSRDPNWNGGRYYERGGIVETLTQLRIETLKLYGIEARLAPAIPDRVAREAAIREVAAKWAREFDGHSLVVLRRAWTIFDAEKDFGRIKARVLYALSRTDKLFPPDLAPDVMAKLKAAGVDAAYVPIDSELGHMASHWDAAKWSAPLGAFLSPLIDRATHPT